MFLYRVLTMYRQGRWRGGHCSEARELASFRGVPNQQGVSQRGEYIPDVRKRGVPAVVASLELQQWFENIIMSLGVGPRLRSLKVRRSSIAHGRCFLSTGIWVIRIVSGTHRGMSAGDGCLLCHASALNRTVVFLRVARGLVCLLLLCCGKSYFSDGCRSVCL